MSRCACTLAYGNMAGHMLMIVLQEISDLLANKMSNQDEDEVEEELEALEAEVSGVVEYGFKLPDVPMKKPELMDAEVKELRKLRAEARARERAAEEERQAVPA